MLRFNLLLRDIPGGDEGNNSEQTLFVRVIDVAGSASTLEYVWQNFEAIGDVLLVDDAANASSRDAFYRDALEGLLPGAHSVWDISSGLPTRDADLRLTLEQFRYLVWYTGNGESPNLLQLLQHEGQFVCFRIRFYHTHHDTKRDQRVDHLSRPLDHRSDGSSRSPSPCC